MLYIDSIPYLTVLHHTLNSVLGKPPGLFEKRIARRFFKKYGETDAINWLIDLQHHRIYAEVRRLPYHHILVPSAFHMNNHVMNLAVRPVFVLSKT